MQQKKCRGLLYRSIKDPCTISAAPGRSVEMTSDGTVKHTNYADIVRVNITIKLDHMAPCHPSPSLVVFNLA